MIERGGVDKPSMSPVLSLAARRTSLLLLQMYNVSKCVVILLCDRFLTPTHRHPLLSPLLLELTPNMKALKYLDRS